MMIDQNLIKPKTKVGLKIFLELIKNGETIYI